MEKWNYHDGIRSTPNVILENPIGAELLPCHVFLGNTIKR